MTAEGTAVHLRGAASDDAADDLALGLRLLHSVAPADGRLVRTYRPTPTAAFSRRETHLPRLRPRRVRGGRCGASRR